MTTLHVIHKCSSCGGPVECTTDCRADNHWHEDCLEQLRAQMTPPWYVRLHAWFLVKFVIPVVVGYRALKIGFEHGKESPGCGLSEPRNGKKERLSVSWSWDSGFTPRLEVNAYCNVCLRPVK